MRYVLFIITFVGFLTLSGCGKNVTGPQLECYGVAINDSSDLLTLYVNGSSFGTASAGDQLGQWLTLSVSVEVDIRWVYPGGKTYKQYHFTPDGYFDDTRDLYGDPADFKITARGSNHR